MSEARRKLKLAIARRTRAWAEVYRHQPDGELLIKSLLLGVQNGVRRRLGTLPEGERHPSGVIHRAFVQGQILAEELPASLIDLYGKCGAYSDEGYIRQSHPLSAS